MNESKMMKIRDLRDDLSSIEPRGGDLDGIKKQLNEVVTEKSILLLKKRERSESKNEADEMEVKYQRQYKKIRFLENTLLQKTTAIENCKENLIRLDRFRLVLKKRTTQSVESYSGEASKLMTPRRLRRRVIHVVGSKTPDPPASLKRPISMSNMEPLSKRFCTLAL